MQPHLYNAPVDKWDASSQIYNMVIIMIANL